MQNVMVANGYGINLGTKRGDPSPADWSLAGVGLRSPSEAVGLKNLLPLLKSAVSWCGEDANVEPP